MGDQRCMGAAHSRYTGAHQQLLTLVGVERYLTYTSLNLRVLKVNDFFTCRSGSRGAEWKVLYWRCPFIILIKRFGALCVMKEYIRSSQNPGHADARVTRLRNAPILLAARLDGRLFQLISSGVNKELFRDRFSGPGSGVFLICNLL